MTFVVALFVSTQIAAQIQPAAAPTGFDAPQASRLAEFSARAFQFAPDNSHLLICTPDNALSAVRIGGDQSKASTRSFTWGRFLTDGSVVAANGAEVEILEFPRYKTLRSWKCSGARLVAVHPKGHQVAVVGSSERNTADVVLTTWDIESAQLIKQTPVTNRIVEIEFQGEEELLSLEGSELVSRRAADLTEIGRAALAHPTRSLAVSGEGWIVTGAQPSVRSGAPRFRGTIGISLWDAKTLKTLPFTPRVHGSYAVVAAHPAGKLLAVGAGNTVSLWNVAEKRGLYQFEAGEHDVLQVGFSPNGKLLAACTGATLKIWDLEQLDKAAAAAAKP